ncbi:MAG: hypothetical protein RLO50_17075 [Azospirillaceae bacterium]
MTTRRPWPTKTRRLQRDGSARPGPWGASGGPPSGATPDTPPPPPADRRSWAPAVVAGGVFAAAAVLIFIAVDRLRGAEVGDLWSWALTLWLAVGVLVVSGIALTWGVIRKLEAGPLATGGSLSFIFVFLLFATVRSGDDPALVLSWHILTGNTTVGEAEVTVSADGGVITLRGAILEPSLVAALNSAVARAPDAALLRLNSVGGDLAIAQRLMALVRREGLATEVERWCLSACTLIFLEGQPAYLDAGARLGFHRPRIEFDANADGVPERVVPAADNSPAIRFMVEAMSRQGATPAFIARVLATPPHDMWYPTREALRAGGLPIASR